MFLGSEKKRKFILSIVKFVPHPGSFPIKHSLLLILQNYKKIEQNQFEEPIQNTEK